MTNKDYAQNMTDGGRKPWIGQSRLEFIPRQPGEVARIVAEVRAALDAEKKTKRKGTR